MHGVTRVLAAVLNIMIVIIASMIPLTDLPTLSCQRLYLLNIMSWRFQLNMITYVAAPTYSFTHIRTYVSSHYAVTYLLTYVRHLPNLPTRT